MIAKDELRISPLPRGVLAFTEKELTPTRTSCVKVSVTVAMPLEFVKAVVVLSSPRSAWKVTGACCRA